MAAFGVEPFKGIAIVVLALQKKGEGSYPRDWTEGF
jgi:hypothetical protein